MNNTYGVAFSRNMTLLVSLICFLFSVHANVFLFALKPPKGKKRQNQESFTLYWSPQIICPFFLLEWVETSGHFLYLNLVAHIV